MSPSGSPAMIRLLQTALICTTVLVLAGMARDRELVVRVVLDLTPLVKRVPTGHGTEPATRNTQ